MLPSGKESAHNLADGRFTHTDTHKRKADVSKNTKKVKLAAHLSQKLQFEKKIGQTWVCVRTIPRHICKGDNFSRIKWQMKGINKDDQSPRQSVTITMSDQLKQ